MCARRERLTAMNRTDRHNDRDVADLQVTYAMLHRDREHVMLICGRLRTLGQDVDCAGVLGVVERDDVSPMVRVAYRPHEQGNATDLRA